jgi:hypothetical protein
MIERAHGKGRFGNVGKEGIMILKWFLEKYFGKIIGLGWHHVGSDDELL